MKRALVGAAVLGLVGCARPLPPHAAQSALYRDLERLVTLQEAGGWEIDRYEVNQLLPDALLSVCHVKAESRDQLLSFIDGRIQALGGPVDQAFEKAGRDLAKVSSALVTVSRMRLVLVKAVRASREDCPFWVTPSDDFGGRQISDDRWTLSLSGGGKGVTAQQDGDFDWSAGGSGRIAVGHAFGQHFTVYGAMELGAGAAFPKDEMGERTSLQVTFDAAFPVVVRYRIVNTYFEGAVGYFLRAPEQDIEDPDAGMHFGLAIGGQGARRRIVFPGVALVVSYERTFWADDPIDLVKVGLRVVLDLDF